jgi:hypothetical protein
MSGSTRIRIEGVASAMWQGEAMIHQEQGTPEKRRVYNEPASFTRYLREKKPGPRAVVNELVDRFKKARDEKEVSVTMQQLADSCKMSKSHVANCIKILVNDGAIVVVSVGSFKSKRKPSSYRLTAYPCRGRPATHDYIEDDREWNRASNKRRSKPTMPGRLILEFPAEHAAAVMLKINQFSEECDEAA